jgi:hypothetical protein
MFQTLLGITNSPVKPTHAKKAPSPIVSTVFGIVKLPVKP